MFLFLFFGLAALSNSFTFIHTPHHTQYNAQKQKYLICFYLLAENLSCHLSWNFTQQILYLEGFNINFYNSLLLDSEKKALWWNFCLNQPKSNKICQHGIDQWNTIFRVFCALSLFRFVKSGSLKIIQILNRK